MTNEVIHGQKVERVDLNDRISIARIQSIEQANPYMDDILRLLNENLIASHPRVTKDDLLSKTKLLADGRVIDNTNQWDGCVFILFDNDLPVGVCISREEMAVKGDTLLKTSRGFGLYVALDANHQSGIWGPFLTACSIESLVQRGCKEVRGSTSIHNKLADKMFSKAVTERIVDGEWVRYLMDLEKYQLMKLRFLEMVDYSKQFELLFNQHEDEKR